MSELVPELASLSQVFVVAHSGDVEGAYSRLSTLLKEVRVGCRIVGTMEELTTMYQPTIETINLLRLMIIFETECSELSIRIARETYPTVFLCVFNAALAESPWQRLDYHKQGVNQVAYEIKSITKIVNDNIFIEPRTSETDARFGCHFCPMTGLTEDELWRHLPAYHINIPNDAEDPCTRCPICNKTSERPMLVHVFENHGPVVRHRSQLKAVATQRITQLYHFSLVVCKNPLTGQYLLSQEFGDQGYWLPGGAVNPGENFTTAAHRKYLEQAGIEIELKGILALEMHPFSPRERDKTNMVRMRVIFYAEPTSTYLASGALPKSVPDFESVGACWVSIRDMESGLKLRGSEPLTWSRYIENNGTIFPLSLLKERPC